MLCQLYTRFAVQIVQNKKMLWNYFYFERFTANRLLHHKQNRTKQCIASRIYFTVIPQHKNHNFEYPLGVALAFWTLKSNQSTGHNFCTLFCTLSEQVTEYILRFVYIFNLFAYISSLNDTLPRKLCNTFL